MSHMLFRVNLHSVVSTGFEPTTTQFTSGHLARWAECLSVRFPTKQLWVQILLQSHKKMTPKNNKRNNTASTKVAPNFSKFCSSKISCISQNFLVFFFLKVFTFSNGNITTLKLKRFLCMDLDYSRPNHVLQYQTKRKCKGYIFPQIALCD